MRLPSIGEQWTHFKGGDYRILNLGFDAELDPPTIVVIYGRKGQVWVRTLDDFLAPLRRESYEGPRFYPTDRTLEKGVHGP